MTAEIERETSLFYYLDKLLTCTSTYEKLHVVDLHPNVCNFFSSKRPLKTFLMGLSPECEYAFKALIAIGQADTLILPIEPDAEKLRELLQTLLALEDFYKSIGGIIGYQYKMLQLLKEQSEKLAPEQTRFFPPVFTDIAKETPETLQAISWGISHLHLMAELYPMGGAADRLHLRDLETGMELPAAKLLLGDKTLLEYLIEDLQAKEYLYYKLYGKQLITPIAMMTSQEKNNHSHVLNICKGKKWFGRPKESFKLFEQPSVPALTEEGNWVQNEWGSLLLKPSGHGALWKLADDCGIFSWLKELGRTKALVRQINNPIAGTDYGLLAFTGIGCEQDLHFGFASCPRLVKAAEGINVLIEKFQDGCYQYALSNIEYCDFAKFGIEDRPTQSGEKYSRFSSNTNILFADLNAVKNAAKKCPFPGPLVNLKTVRVGKKEQRIARLETTMQNIADVFIETTKAPRAIPVTKKTYVTYNHRKKTISTAKKVFSKDKSYLETPESCFYDLLKNSRELLQRCGFLLPPQETAEEYLEKGPSFLFLYHPSLGPIYSIIEQKIRKGLLHKGAEWRTRISELDVENLTLKGSLCIEAENPMGHLEGDYLHYSGKSGKCRLKNVSIDNLGIDRDSSGHYWKNEIIRKESLRILLHKNAEFSAENCTFKGNFFFEVPENKALHITEEKGKLISTWKSLESWEWEYFEENQKITICLKK